jgi:hypothetical protein
MEKGP